MNPCEDCLYYPICIERRGRCSEYETQEMKNKRIADEIKSLCEKAKSAKSPGSDTSGKSGD